MKISKKCEICPALAVKNEKMADFCGFAGVFVSKRAFFCKKNAPKWGGCLLCFIVFW